MKTNTILHVIVVATLIAGTALLLLGSTSLGYAILVIGALAGLLRYINRDENNDDDDYDNWGPHSHDLQI